MTEGMYVSAEPIRLLCEVQGSSKTGIRVLVRCEDGWVNEFTVRRSLCPPQASFDGCAFYLVGEPFEKDGATYFRFHTEEVDPEEERIELMRLLGPTRESIEELTRLTELERALLLAVLVGPGKSLNSIELDTGFCEQLLPAKRHLEEMGFIREVPGQKDREEGMRSLEPNL